MSNSVQLVMIMASDNDNDLLDVVARSPAQASASESSHEAKDSPTSVDSPIEQEELNGGGAAGNAGTNPQHRPTLEQSSPGGCQLQDVEAQNCSPPRQETEHSGAPGDGEFNHDVDGMPTSIFVPISHSEVTSSGGSGSCSTEASGSSPSSFRNSRRESSQIISDLFAAQEANDSQSQLLQYSHITSDGYLYGPSVSLAYHDPRSYSQDQIRDCSKGCDCYLGQQQQQHQSRDSSVAVNALADELRAGSKGTNQSTSSNGYLVEVSRANLSSSNSYQQQQQVISHLDYNQDDDRQAKQDVSNDDRKSTMNASECQLCSSNQNNYNLSQDIRDNQHSHVQAHHDQYSGNQHHEPHHYPNHHLDHHQSAGQGTTTTTTTRLDNNKRIRLQDDYRVDNNNNTNNNGNGHPNGTHIYQSESAYIGQAPIIEYFSHSDAGSHQICDANDPVVYEIYPWRETGLYQMADYETLSDNQHCLSRATMMVEKQEKIYHDLTGPTQPGSGLGNEPDGSSSSGAAHLLLLDQHQQMVQDSSSFDPLCDDLFDCQTHVDNQANLPIITKDYDPSDEIPDYLLDCMDYERTSDDNNANSNHTSHAHHDNLNDDDDDDDVDQRDKDYNRLDEDYEDDDEEEEDDDDSDYEDGSVGTVNSTRHRKTTPTANRARQSKQQASGVLIPSAPRCSTGTIDALRRMLQLKAKSLVREKATSPKPSTSSCNKSVNQRETTPSSRSSTGPIGKPKVTIPSTNRPLTRSYLKFNGLTGKV